MNSRQEQVKNRMQRAINKKKQEKSIQNLHIFEEKYLEYYGEYEYFNQTEIDKKRMTHFANITFKKQNRNVHALMLDVYKLDVTLKGLETILQERTDPKLYILQIKVAILLVRLVILQEGVSDLSCLDNPSVIISKADSEWHAMISQGLLYVVSVYEKYKDKLVFNNDSIFQKEFGFSIINHIAFNKRCWSLLMRPSVMYRLILHFLENCSLNLMKIDLYYRLFIIIRDENKSKINVIDNALHQANKVELLISEYLLNLENDVTHLFINNYFQMEKDFEKNALLKVLTPKQKIEQVYANYFMYGYYVSYQLPTVDMLSETASFSWDYMTTVISLFGKYFLKNLSILETIPHSELEKSFSLYHDFDFQYREILRITLSITRNVIIFSKMHAMDANALPYCQDAKEKLLVIYSIFKEVCRNYNDYIHHFDVKDYNLLNTIAEFQQHINDFNKSHNKSPLILPEISLNLRATNIPNKIQQNKSAKKKRKKNKKTVLENAQVIAPSHIKPIEKEIEKESVIDLTKEMSPSVKQVIPNKEKIKKTRVLTKSSKKENQITLSRSKPLLEPIDKQNDLDFEERKKQQDEIEYHHFKQLRLNAQLLAREETSAEAMRFFASEITEASSQVNLNRYMESIDIFLPSFGQGILNKLVRLRGLMGDVRKLSAKPGFYSGNAQEQLKSLLPQVCNDLKNIQKVNNRYQITLKENKKNIPETMQDGLVFSLESNNALIAELEDKINDIQSSYDQVLYEKNREREKFILNLGKQKLEEKGNVCFTDEEAFNLGIEEFKKLGELNKSSGRVLSYHAKQSSFLKGLQPYFNDLKKISFELSGIEAFKQKKGPLCLELPVKIKAIFSMLGANYYLAGSQVANLIRMHYKLPHIQTADYDFVSFNASKKELISLGFTQSKNNENLYVYYLDGERIEVFVTTKEDFKPDFTIAGLRVDGNGNVFDLTGNGEKDLGNRLIRTTGSSAERITRDPVIILRAIKYLILGFQLDKDLKKAILRWEPKEETNFEHLYAVAAKEIRRFKDEYVNKLSHFNVLKKMFGIEKGSIAEMRIQLEKKLDIKREVISRERFFKEPNPVKKDHKLFLPAASIGNGRK